MCVVSECKGGRPYRCKWRSMLNQCWYIPSCMCTQLRRCCCHASRSNSRRIHRSSLGSYLKRMQEKARIHPVQRRSVCAYLCMSHPSLVWCSCNQSCRCRLLRLCSAHGSRRNLHHNLHYWLCKHLQTTKTELPASVLPLAVKAKHITCADSVRTLATEYVTGLASTFHGIIGWFVWAIGVRVTSTVADQTSVYERLQKEHRRLMVFY